MTTQDSKRKEIDFFWNNCDLILSNLVLACEYLIQLVMPQNNFHPTRTSSELKPIEMKDFFQCGPDDKTLFLSAESMF